VDLTNHFLIAMPSMADPNFSRTLTYICEHNDRGALGLVVNRPIDMTVGDLLGKIGLSPEGSEFALQPVYYGGPVQQDRGFVLHRPLGSWRSTLPVRDLVGLSTSRDILEAVAGRSEDAPRQILVTLGYAGWAAGQLEHELARNAWLTVEASDHVIFELPPEARLAAAMELLGIDFARLHDAAGHA